MPILIVGFCGIAIAMSVGTWYMLSQYETRSAIRKFERRTSNWALAKGCLTITSAPLDPTAACRLLPNGMNTFQNSIRPKRWALLFMESISIGRKTQPVSEIFSPPTVK